MGRPSEEATKNDVDQSIEFLQLPLELVTMVADELPLHDRFLLSQSCSALRAWGAKGCMQAIKRLHRGPRLTFWTQVARSLSGYWVCKVCCKLHKTDPRDVPQHGLIPPCQKGQVREFDRMYKLRQTHVQLALKLSRRGDGNQEYLRKIMAPFTLSGAALPNRSLFYYQATPKVVSGRFLLKTEWYFWRHKYQLQVACNVAAEFCPRGICPHLFVPNYDLPGDSSFHNNINKTCTSTEEIQDYCHFCPTYYTIQADGDAARVRAYYDFGAQEHPMNKFWAAHTTNKVGVTRYYDSWKIKYSFDHPTEEGVIEDPELSD